MASTVYILILLVIVAVSGAQETRIVGGEDATPHEFVYQCSLQAYKESIDEFKHFCAGSIITTDWVLTAAHCGIGISMMRVAVVAGAYNISATENTSQNTVIDFFVQHEDYDPDSNGIGPNDIALIKVNPAFEFNDYINRLFIPLRPLDGWATWLCGWGSTSRSTNPDITDILQKALLPLVPLNICQRLNSEVTLTDKQLCTGPLDGSKGVCVGDSGGALIQYFLGIPLQIGIVSFGHVPCAGINQTTVYTDVTKYIDWLQHHIRNY